jgi:hypothetical protein
MARISSAVASQSITCGLSGSPYAATGGAACAAYASLGDDQAALEHDPEKWVPVLPCDKREAFARRSCFSKKVERDADSTKRIAGLLTVPTDSGWATSAPVSGLELPVFRILPLQIHDFGSTVGRD